MRFTVCESTEPEVKQLLEKYFILWYADVDVTTDYYQYSSGLDGYILPLIAVISMDSPDTYLDRSTSTQSSLYFNHRLKQHIGDINHSGSIGLDDAILSLQILSGTATSDNVYQDGDINGDLRIGLSEGIYLLNNIENNQLPADCDEVTSTCNGIPVVLSAGQTWMDRNLGATRVATSVTDNEAYGDLYQWGRGTDGHQLRDSNTTSEVSSNYIVSHTNFITVPTYPYDWLAIRNDDLWQGASGINNPCPTGFRLPTIEEFDREKAFWTPQNSSGAFNSPLKFTLSGYKTREGIIENENIVGLYWTSSVNGAYVRYISSYYPRGTYSYGERARGMSVRCIKD